MVRVFGRSRSFSFSFKRIFERQHTNPTTPEATAPLSKSLCGTPAIAMEAQQPSLSPNDAPPVARKEPGKPPSGRHHNLDHPSFCFYFLLMNLD